MTVKSIMVADIYLLSCYTSRFRFLDVRCIYYGLHCHLTSVLRHPKGSLVTVEKYSEHDAPFE